MYIQEYLQEYILNNKRELIRYSDYLSSNPGAIPFLKENPEFIHWDSLVANPNAIELIEKNIDFISSQSDLWGNLCSNPSAMHLIESRPSAINWIQLSLNPHPRAIALLQANQSRIDWRHLSMNEGAISLLEQNIHRIHWYFLSSNKKALHLIKMNLRMASFRELRNNPEAFELLLHYSNKMNFGYSNRNNDLYCCPHPKVVNEVEKKLKCKYKKNIWDGNISVEEYPYTNSCANPYLTEFFIKNPNLIDMYEFSKNPEAINYLEENLEKMGRIDFIGLMQNPNPSLWSTEKYVLK